MIDLRQIIAPSFYEVHRNIRDKLYTHYWLKGGRGSTKSSFASIEIIMGIMRDKNANCVALRKVGETLEDSVYNQLLWAIEILGVEQYFETKRNPLQIIYKPTRQMVVFRSAFNNKDVKKIKSTKFIRGYAKYIWYEELDEFDGIEDVRTINQSLLRGGDEFVVFYTFNPPKSKNNWVNQEVLETREDKLIHDSNYLDVPREWLGEQFIKEAEHLQKTKQLAYENEYLGIATGSGGDIFDNLTNRIITEEEIKTFDNLSSGVDFGYAVDPAVFTENHYDKTRKKLYIFNELYKSGISNRGLHEEIIQIKKGSKPTICDSAEPKSINELNSYAGNRYLGAKKGPDSVEYGIKWLQGLEEIIIDPVRCPNTIREFSNYEYERDKMGNFKSRYPDYDNHIIDATRYSREEDMKTNKMTLGFNKII